MKRCRSAFLQVRGIDKVCMQDSVNPSVNLSLYARFCSNLMYVFAVVILFSNLVDINAER